MILSYKAKTCYLNFIVITLILCFHEEKEAHARPLLTEINVLNVCQINNRQILTFMQKVKNTTNPGAF